MQPTHPSREKSLATRQEVGYEYLTAMTRQTAGRIIECALERRKALSRATTGNDSIWRTWTSHVPTISGLCDELLNLVEELRIQPEHEERLKALITQVLTERGAPSPWGGAVAPGVIG